MEEFSIDNNCVDIDALDSNILDWLDGLVEGYDIDPQGYCVYVSLTGSLQGDADISREDGSFGGSNW